jgi:ElaB/YqjD/DUF883 family membrane-anchored ribosome-binding protein
MESNSTIANPSEPNNILTKGTAMSAHEINTDHLVADLKRVVRDSEELLAATASVAGDKAHEMRQRIGRSLEAAKDACLRLEEKAIAGAKATDKVIREHPYQSIGVAFGVGLLIGVLVTRR